MSKRNKQKHMSKKKSDLEKKYNNSTVVNKIEEEVKATVEKAPNTTAPGSAHNKLVVSGIDNNSFDFKKKVLFGVDKLDVLKKIRNINIEYQRILYENNLSCQAIIQDKNNEIEKISEENKQLKIKINNLEKENKDLKKKSTSKITKS